VFDEADGPLKTLSSVPGRAPWLAGISAQRGY
jgi:hypothetical protein